MATQTERHKNARQEVTAKNGTKLVIAMKNSCTSGFVSHWCCRATNDLVADVIEATKLSVGDSTELLSVFLGAINTTYGSDLVTTDYDFYSGKWNRASQPVAKEPIAKANAENPAFLLLNQYITDQFKAGRTESDIKAEFLEAKTPANYMAELFPDKKQSVLAELMAKLIGSK